MKKHQRCTAVKHSCFMTHDICSKTFCVLIKSNQSIVILFQWCKSYVNHLIYSPIAGRYQEIHGWCCYYYFLPLRKPRAKPNEWIREWIPTAWSLHPTAPNKSPFYGMIYLKIHISVICSSWKLHQMWLARYLRTCAAIYFCTLWDSLIQVSVPDLDRHN